MLYGIKSRTLVTISTLMTAVFLIGLLNLLRVNETVTGNMVVETESTSIAFVFVAIALVAGAVLFLTLYNKFGKRY